MPKRFLWYRVALRLYPSAYRRQYGEQMLQTLADMLDDQPDRASKAMVWLRVGSELPLSIVNENISNIGERAMNRLALITNKRLVGGLAAALVIVSIFTLPAWIRHTVIPRTVSLIHGREVHATLLDQQKKIGQPFTAIADKAATYKSFCALVIASDIKTRVHCQSSMQVSMELPHDTAGKQKVLDAVKTIEAALKKEGYTSGSNGVTFSGLVAGTYEGKDYSPDAYYEKKVGPHSCVFDTQIAYSNPSPAAINMVSWCWRVVDVFGAPDETTKVPNY